MNYLQRAMKISILLYSNVNLIKKFNLCIMQLYLIKKYVKKLRDKYKKEVLKER